MKCQYVLNLPFNTKIYFGTWFADSNSENICSNGFKKKKDFDIQYVTFLWNKKSLNEKQGCIS